MFTACTAIHDICNEILPLSVLRCTQIHLLLSHLHLDAFHTWLDEVLTGCLCIAVTKHRTQYCLHFEYDWIDFENENACLRQSIMQMSYSITLSLHLSERGDEGVKSHENIEAETESCFSFINE